MGEGAVEMKEAVQEAETSFNEALLLISTPPLRSLTSNLVVRWVKSSSTKNLPSPGSLKAGSAALYALALLSVKLTNWSIEVIDEEYGPGVDDKL